jgi:glycosyltransferase involved in cell wall biosynthesis
LVWILLIHDVSIWSLAAKTDVTKINDVNMSVRPRLSVVIPTSDRCEILRLCLAHIEAQSLSRDAFEVIVVDDGSTDGTHIFLNEYTPGFAFRHFRKDTRGGPAQARNVGILAAKGDIVLFLNDDALLEPDGLRVHLETHLAAKDIGVSVLGRFELPQSFRSHLWGYTLTNSDLVFDYGALRTDTLYGGGYYYTCNISTPRKALLEVGLFDESFTGKYWGAEDIEIGHRLAHLAPPVGILFREGCAAEHRHHLNVTDFARMFRVRGGGAVNMFVRHKAMHVHYRDIGAMDVLYWRNLPEAVERRVLALQALLRTTEAMALPLATPGDPAEAIAKHGLREQSFPALHRSGLSLWRMREDQLIPQLDVLLDEVDRTLEAAQRGECSMQVAARGVYPACLYLRWHHDTEGVCASPAIAGICKDPLEISRATSNDAAPVSVQDKGQKFIFSIVTAAFNAAPWIEIMLSSLEQQSLGFAANIQLVVVDDGSTDETATIVGRWAARYPGNIVLLRQENSGPAAARNLGLTRAEGEWISFLDADDFVDASYFQTVRDFLARAAYDGPVVACNTVLFLDVGNRTVDGHPLSYKFKETRVVDLLQEPDHIQLFVNSCLFRRSDLESNGLRFDPKIRPTFEDAHFLNLVLLRTKDFRVAFLKEAQYFYRKRGMGTGLVESGWASPAKYRDQILFGYLNLAQEYHRALGHTPAFVQNLILYEAHWFLVRMLDGALPVTLGTAQVDELFDLMSLLFHHVDARHILLSTLPALELRTRVAMLRAFKDTDFSGAPFILSDIAPDGREAQLQHWSTRETHYALRSAKGDVPIPWRKSIVHRFYGRVLAYEWRAWIPLPEDMDEAVCPDADGEQLGVACRGHLLENLDRAGSKRAFFVPQNMLSEQQRAILTQAAAPEKADMQGCWVFMDRVHKADDNAEHLCRWVMREHPELTVRFVLDRKSTDWQRLEREGFPLLAYHSRAHFLALASAAWLVSSHVDPSVADPLGTRDLFGLPTYKLAFLQHGVIKDDLSRWLNQIRLDFMVASARQEYDSLIQGRYKLTTREVALTGLPRHDALLRKAQVRKPGRTILFCPTWREHLRRTEAHIPGLQEAEVQRFRESYFFRAWSGVTGSLSLARLARERGYKLLFLPHPEVVRFLPMFPRSEAFTFLDWTGLKSVQDFLVSCAMAVTDYSSLAFEFAYLGRPVAYYQFPETPDIYSAHVWQRGYFDCESHGLGPVLRTAEDVEAWLNDMTRLGGLRQEPYESRAQAFFTLRDGQNCRRAYEAILARS